MSYSGTIVIRDLVTGAGSSGLTAKFRRIDDAFASDYMTLVEIAGKPGVYQFTDLPLNIYKLWVNGSEDKTFGGDSGRPYPPVPYASLLTYIAANLSLAADKITSGTLDVARIPDMAATKITSGTFDVARIPAGISAVKISSGVVDSTMFDYLLGAGELIQVALNQIPRSSNVLVVDSNFAGSSVWRYATIQAAINYAQASMTPGANNQIYILIMPSKSGTGFSENVTLQPYVHLVGLGAHTRIYGSMGGASANTRLYNLLWNYAGNFALNAVKAKDCVFRCICGVSNYNITLQNNVFDNVGLFNVTGESGNGIIQSLGGNTFFAKCYSNILFELTDTDKGNSDSFNDASVSYSF